MAPRRVVGLAMGLLVRTLLLLLLLIVSSAAPASGGQGEWPGFKGQSRMGVGDGPAPSRWDGQSREHVAWSAPIPGIGHSSPVVWGHQVFVTTAVPDRAAAYPVGLSEDIATAVDGRRYAWRVMSLDLRSGRTLWDRTLHEGLPRSKRHSKNSFATPTPATDGRYLVVYMGSEGLYGLDMQGNVLWKQDLGVLEIGFYLDPSYQWGISSSPVIYRDLVIVQVDLDRGSYLAAYDLRTGRQVWKTPRHDGQSWSTPVLYLGAPRDLLVANAASHVRAYDPRTGRELWQLRWDMEIVLSTPTVANGLIYSASGKGDRQPIVAVRPTARGEVPLADAHGGPRSPLAWSRLTGGAIVTSPLVYGECLYALVDLGVLRCVSPSTGEIHYQQRIPDSFLASPVAADGKVYLASEDGNIYVVRAGPRYELIAVNPMGEPSVATPAFARGRLIIRTIGHVVAVGDLVR
jgi:outer membrane protein assembly factor BamB